MDKKQLNFLIDGASRGNPGPAGYGIAVYDPRWQKKDALKGHLGTNTNNFAEYSALIRALEYALEHGVTHVKIFTDSELVVRQMKGLYKIRSKNIIPLVAKAFSLVRRLESFEIRKIPREKNKAADLLANEAIDTK
jgi:ribonuclease HI